MNRALALTLMALALAACSPTYEATPTAAARTGKQKAAAPAFETSTPVPTSTPGWQATGQAAQATAQVAQATSNASIQLMMEVTEQSIQATRQAEDHAFAIAQWTKEAPPTPTLAPTSTPDVPAAATTRAMLVGALALKAGYATSTAYAPTLQAQVLRDKQAGYVWPVGMLAIFILVIALSFFIYRLSLEAKYPQPVARPTYGEVLQQRSAAAETAGAEHFGTVITLKSEVDRSGHRYIFPATPEQMDALADGLVNQQVPLSVRNWTGSGKPFAKSSSWVALRNFLQEHQLVISTGVGGLAITPRLREILDAWQAGHPLPYNFEVTSDEGAPVLGTATVRANARLVEAPEQAPGVTQGQPDDRPDPLSDLQPLPPTSRRVRPTAEVLGQSQ